MSNSLIEFIHATLNLNLLCKELWKSRGCLKRAAFFSFRVKKRGSRSIPLLVQVVILLVFN